jgi:hypothetical protein
MRIGEVVVVVLIGQQVLGAGGGGVHDDKASRPRSCSKGRSVKTVVNIVVDREGKGAWRRRDDGKSGRFVTSTGLELATM